MNYLLNISKNLFFFACLIGCSHLPLHDRHLASDDSAADTEKTQKNAYYLARIPSQYQKKLILDAQKISDYVTYCRSSDYGPWIQPLKDPSLIQQRDQFLLHKMNRSFILATIEELQQKSSYLIGNDDDARELTCISLSTREGKLEEKENIEPYFAKQVSKLENINAVILNYALFVWL